MLCYWICRQLLVHWFGHCMHIIYLELLLWHWDTMHQCQASDSKSRWRHQMETFSALLALCAGNSQVTGEFHSQRPVTRSFDVFFDLRLNKDWVNNREADDLRRHSVHHDVIVMWHGWDWLVSDERNVTAYARIFLGCTIRMWENIITLKLRNHSLTNFHSSSVI